MKVLIAHNTYQRPGGEDQVFRTEASLLEQHGHDVIRYSVDNHDVGRHNAVSLAARTIWNPDSRHEIIRLIRRVRPDVMHVHNTLPLISPSIYGAAQREGVAVVQTLHNYRLACPGALLLRDGKPCEKCIGTVSRWPAVVHRCYRGSRAASGAVAAMLTVHTVAGTWNRMVDRYIAMSDFARGKMIASGLPPERIVVKPNCVAPDPGMRSGSGTYALYLGRLSPEKGIATLLEAWRRIPDAPLLKIAGDGPLMPHDRSSDAGVMWLGHQPRESVLELLRGALLLIVPSEWYEGSPLTVMDAFAVGTPVLASRIGSLAEIIDDRVSGLLFEPGSPDALARSVEWARARPAELHGMARRARHEFETKYTAQSTYAALTRIYADAIQSRENGHGSQTNRSSTRRTVHFSSDSGAGPSPG